MKLLATIGVGFCLISAVVPPALAQYQNLDWLDVSPPGEPFQISMPNRPRVEVEKVGAVSGKRYMALTAQATYTIWSITNANYPANNYTDTDAYLDATADLVWDGLLKSAREKVDERDRRFTGIAYEKELPPEELPPKGLPGREYNLTIGDLTGTMQFFVAKEHIFVMLVMGKPGEDWPSEKFFASFKTSLAPALVMAPTPNGGGVAPTISANSTEPEDYNRVFTGKEVTSKVRVLEKPEPIYSDSARNFRVTGTVILRCVFAKNGEVTNIHVVKKLPHGLTQRTMAAARSIRFTPATKDGRPVSMWMELQYNFNLY